jgi:hypothetical protein
MLTEEKINLNFVNFTDKLEKYNIFPDKMKEDVEFNESLRVASAFTSEDSGGAYEGSLIEHITRIAIIAFNVNKMLQEEVTVPIDSLIKVCYLHQISRALMIKKNTVEWEVKKGKPFTFDKSSPALKTGEYSIFLCNEYGIKLSVDEYEAILSIDKLDDAQTKYFSNSLSQILRVSIELANTERKLRYKYYTKG